MKLGRKLAAGIVEERERPPAPEPEPDGAQGASGSEHTMDVGDPRHGEALTGRAADG